MSPLSAEPTNIVGVVGAVVVLSLMAVLTISGVVLYYNPLLCLRGRSKLVGRGGIIPNLPALPDVLESATDYPRLLGIILLLVRSPSALEELGWNERPFPSWALQASCPELLQGAVQSHSCSPLSELTDAQLVGATGVQQKQQ